MIEELPESDPIQKTFRIIASILGLVLVFFGLWALGGAIYIAWGLVQEPDSIGYFVKYITDATKITTHLKSEAEGAAHFLAWFVVILLLLVLGKLGDWAISVGARLLNLRGFQAQ